MISRTKNMKTISHTKVQSANPAVGSNEEQPSDQPAAANKYLTDVKAMEAMTRIVIIDSQTLRAIAWRDA